MRIYKWNTSTAMLLSPSCRQLESYDSRLRSELNLIAILFVLAIVLSGCSSSYSVSSIGKPDADYSYQEINEELKGRNVTIELKDGRDISARDVNVSNDSVSWLDASTAKQSRVTTPKLDRIVVEDRLAGGLNGMKYGAIVGGCLGVVAAIMGVGKAGEGGDFGNGQGNALLYGLVVVGGSGAAIGFIYGIIIGHRDEYELPTTEQPDSLQDGK